MPLDTAKLAALRHTAGLSQSAAAKLLGVSRQYWSQLESGGVADPSISTLQRLAQVLKVTEQELLTPFSTKPKPARAKA